MPDLKSELTTKIVQRPEPSTEETKSRATPQRMMSTPLFTVRLAQELKNEAEAARRIGMSHSGLGMGVRRGTISTTAEIAAKGVLAEIEARKANKAERDNSEVVLIARVPPDKKQALILVAEAMGVQFKEV